MYLFSLCFRFIWKIQGIRLRCTSASELMSVRYSTWVFCVKMRQKACATTLYVLYVGIEKKTSDFSVRYLVYFLIWTKAINCDMYVQDVHEEMCFFQITATNPLHVGEPVGVCTVTPIGRLLFVQPMAVQVLARERSQNFQNSSKYNICWTPCIPWKMNRCIYPPWPWIVVKDWLVPLDNDVFGVGDELWRGLAVVNHGRFNI